MRVSSAWGKRGDQWGARVLKGNTGQRVRAFRPLGPRCIECFCCILIRMISEGLEWVLNVREDQWGARVPKVSAGQRVRASRENWGVQLLDASSASSACWLARSNGDLECLTQLSLYICVYICNYKGSYTYEYIYIYIITRIITITLTSLPITILTYIYIYIYLHIYSSLYICIYIYTHI